VVVEALAPEIPGYQSTPVYPVPARLSDALATQTDLSEIPGQGGLEVYVDTASASGRLPAPGASSSLYRAGIVVEVVIWLAALSALLGARRWMGRWRRRRLYRAQEAAMGGSMSPGGSGQGPADRHIAATPAGVGR